MCIHEYVANERTFADSPWFATQSRCNWTGEKVNAHHNVSFFFFFFCTLVHMPANLLHFLPKQHDEQQQQLTEMPKTFCLFFRFAFTLTSLSLFRATRLNHQSPQSAISFHFFFLAIRLETEWRELLVLRTIFWPELGTPWTLNNNDV